jgi:hypothetical protein
VHPQRAEAVPATHIIAPDIVAASCLTAYLPVIFISTHRTTSSDIKKAEEGPKFCSPPAAMSTNESTNEVRQAAIIEQATSDKLEVSLNQPWPKCAATDEDEDVSPPLSPEIELDEIAYRADVGPGGWKVVCLTLCCTYWTSADATISLFRSGRSAKVSA